MVVAAGKRMERLCQTEDYERIAMRNTATLLPRRDPDHPRYLGERNAVFQTRSPRGRNLLVDGKEWVVPGGVAVRTDSVGGMVAVLVVP